MKVLTTAAAGLLCFVLAGCSKPTTQFSVADEVQYSYSTTGKPDVCIPAGNSNSVRFQGVIASKDSGGYTVKWQKLSVRDFPSGTACTKNPTVWDNTSGTAYSAVWQAHYLGSPGVVPPYFPDLPAKFDDTQLKLSERE
jgi:hypothetical protein